MSLNDDASDTPSMPPLPGSDEDDDGSLGDTRPLESVNPGGAASANAASGSASSSSGGGRASSSSAAGRASLDGDDRADAEDEERADGEGDYAAEDFPFFDRLKHFLAGSKINPTTHRAVEAVLLIEAGSDVSEDQPNKAGERNRQALKKYLEKVDAIPAELFDDERKMRGKLKTKLFNAHDGLTGEKVWARYTTIRSDIRANYLNNLPKNLCGMASGTQLHDSYRKFCLERYKEKNTEDVAGMEDEDIDVPINFEFKDSKTYLLLTVKVHRKNKEIAPATSDLPSGPTRDELRRKAAESRAEEKAAKAAKRAAKEAKASRKFKKLKLIAAEGSVIQQRTNTIATQLQLAESFKSSLGKKCFESKVKEIFKRMPDPAGGKSIFKDGSDDEEDGSSSSSSSSSSDGSDSENS